jgi:23S rRNA (uridine2552-2'-O)-methyltransferase
MAPNFSGVLEDDHLDTVHLNMVAISVAYNNLRPGGTLLMKSLYGFHEKKAFGYMGKLFKEFVRVKPSSSRSGSSELYYLGTGFRETRTYLELLRLEKMVAK